MKFFVMSDIHGFYDEMRSALDAAGFNPDDENHWLITCGDHFDRGPKPLQVMEYLMGLPRKILVKGNHEELLLKCIDRGYALSHDWYNGTAQTIVGFAPNAQEFNVACSVTYDKVKDFINEMTDYFELKNHIFVHSWIPLTRKFEFNPDWRYATQNDWYEARWGNPFELAEQGLLPDKTVVFGHFHTSYAWSKYENKPEWGKEADFSIYRGNGYIGVDGCCAYSGKVNVLVLEDEFIDA